METNLNTKLYPQASLSQERGPVAISQEAGRQPAVQGQLAPVTSGHFSSKPKELFAKGRGFQHALRQSAEKPRLFQI